MRILVTTPELTKKGGVASYWQAVLPALNGYVDSLTVGARRGESFLRCSLRVWRDGVAFFRRLRRKRYDLAHLNPSLARKAILRDGVFLLIAKLCGAKVLVYVHGWDAACEALIRRRCLYLFRSVYFQADAFVVLGSQYEAALRELGYTKTIYVETTVVPDEVFSRVNLEERERKRSPCPLNLLLLTRVEKAKGVYCAVEAFRILREKYPFVTMTIAGDGSDLVSLKRHVEAQSIAGVEFLGWVEGEAKHRAFAAADVYLFPTCWGEGCPCSVLEAMAYGLPVVTRPVGGIADFFEDGKMGFLTESKEPHVFAGLVERLLQDHARRHAIARYNHLFAKQHFSASVVAMRLTRIYQETTNSACIVNMESK
jgi:glycosyltransferase involved in cell wall biosynthesis